MLVLVLCVCFFVCLFLGEVFQPAFTLVDFQLAQNQSEKVVAIFKLPVSLWSYN